MNQEQGTGNFQLDAIAIAKQRVAEQLGCSEVELSAEDKTHLYPWFSEHSMVWISDAERKIRCCVVTAEGEGLLFSEPWDTARLSRVLRDEELELPGDLEPADLGRCLRDLLRGPGGLVGTQQDLARERQGLVSWLRPEHDFDTEKAMFERCFRDPALRRDGDDWSLDYFYFSRDGGVEQWEVAGDGQGITGVEVKQTVPSGRFRYPYM